MSDAANSQGDSERRSGRRRRPRRSRRSRKGGAKPTPEGGGKPTSEGGAKPKPGGGRSRGSRDGAPGGEGSARPGRKTSRRRRRRRPRSADTGGDRESVAAVAAAAARVEERPEAVPGEWTDGGASSAPAPELKDADLDRWAPPVVELDPDGEDVFQVEDWDAEGDEAEAGGNGRRKGGKVVNLSSVRLPHATRVHDYDAGELTLRRGDEVVVQTDRGQALGTVLSESVRMVVGDPPQRRVLRRINDNDRRQQRRNLERAAEALPFARERISERRLPMKLTRVEYVHGGSKAVFYFSAEGRVDFRELVKDLAQQLRIRIEMRQIGVRDEAKMVGGIGLCGLRLCCQRYLTKFEPVSIRMAKDQNLVLNPQKVSGQCGRLKCCLAYEQQIYREQRKGMPKLGKMVVTPEGEGKVVELDILKRRVRVVIPGSGSQVYEADDVIPKHLAQQQAQRRAAEDAPKESEPREASGSARSVEPPARDGAPASAAAEDGGAEAKPAGDKGPRSRRSGRSRRSRGGRRGRSGRRSGDRGKDGGGPPPRGTPSGSAPSS